MKAKGDEGLPAVFYSLLDLSPAGSSPSWTRRDFPARRRNLQAKRLLEFQTTAHVAASEYVARVFAPNKYDRTES
jgi:hypothetical protein